MKTLLKKDGVRAVLATIISILIGLLVGSLLVALMGLLDSRLSFSSVWVASSNSDPTPKSLRLLKSHSSSLPVKKF